MTLDQTWFCYLLDDDGKVCGCRILYAWDQGDAMKQAKQVVLESGTSGCELKPRFGKTIIMRQGVPAEKRRSSKLGSL